MKILSAVFRSRLLSVSLLAVALATLAEAQPVIIGIDGVAAGQDEVAPFGFALMQGQNIADANGAEVTVNGVPALVVPDPGETSFVTFQLPRETAVGPADFVVTVGGVASAPFNFSVSEFAPVIADEGQALRQDGSPITNENAPIPGETVTITGITGLGAGDSPQVTVTIGGLPVQVLSLQDNVPPFFLAGAYTMALIVPELAPGFYPGTLTVGGATYMTPGLLVVGSAQGQAPPSIREITGVGSDGRGLAPRAPAEMFGSNIMDANGNAEVAINGVSAPVFPEPGTTDRLLFQIPPQTAPGEATATVSVNGLVSAPFSFTVREFAPVVTDDSMVLRLDQSALSETNPAEPGETIVITGLTGLGAAQEPPPVSVQVGPLAAEVVSLRENGTQMSALRDSFAMPVVHLPADVPGVYTLEIKVPELDVGAYSWSLTVGGAPLSVDDQPVFVASSDGQLPTITVASAANFKTDGFAAEMIVSGFANTTAFPFVFEGAGLPLPTTISGVKVVVTDSIGVTRDALLFGVFNPPGQVNFLIPATTALGTATVTLEVVGQPVATGTVEINEFAPGIFTANASGAGVAAALFIKVPAEGAREQDLIFDQALQPVPLDLGGEGDQLYLSLFGTGMRGGNGAGVQQASGVLAEVNGVVTGVLAVADSPEFAGLDQVAIGPINRDLLSGKGEVDLELWFGDVSTGLFTAAFGGEVITPSPQITDATPSIFAPGQTSSVTLTGSRLMPINRVEFSPDSDFTVSNIVGMNTMTTFDVSVEGDADAGPRTLAVVTPEGRSNRFDVSVSQAVGSGTAPTISDLDTLVLTQQGDFYLITAIFNAEDPDGDLIWLENIDNSAKVELRVTGGNDECVFVIGGPEVLNSPAFTMPLLINAGMDGQAPLERETGMAALTLFDAAQNQSETLTIEVNFRPIPDACNPDEPIVLVRPASDFVIP